ncbi:Pollen allergen Che a 1 like [Actinidia chinensis var. chinensis]|uniref:Pollen allergen Che a 1 like n=1 Tax=Actinidia chinensis var. chinensis TaxID=1590841 RepID=A0A2R6RYI8_ACTCC|nr:Pollen allergen Che a 1 like [Actinidia chinensis var. chinensis]
MENFRTSWFLTVIVLSFTFPNLSEAKHEKKLPSAIIVGTVYCDTCFQESFSKSSHFISGALVGVQCGGTSSSPSFHEKVKTNDHGEFKVHLPSSVAKHVGKIKGCSVRLISSGEPYCAVASTATSSSLRLKSRNQGGTHIFSAGFFTFKPLKQPILCSQKPSLHNSREFNSQKSPIPDDPTFPPTIQDPPMPLLPPIDQNNLPPQPILPPLPQLPPLPPIPGIPPVAKIPLKTSEFTREEKFFLPTPQIPLLPSPIPALPPIPFLPPPSILPPNPLQPPQIPLLPSPPPIFGIPGLPPNPFQPPPSILPPNPLQPPPSSVFPPIPFPPIPGLTHPPPPPPAFPIPLPPVFPGIPPASP